MPSLRVGKEVEIFERKKRKENILIAARDTTWVPVRSRKKGDALIATKEEAKARRPKKEYDQRLAGQQETTDWNEREACRSQTSQTV